MRYADFMIVSISANGTNIASTVLYAYYYNLSICRCHIQPMVWQRNSYCIHDIHMTGVICSCTPISRVLIIYRIPFTHADILIFPVVYACLALQGTEIAISCIYTLLKFECCDSTLKYWKVYMGAMVTPLGCQMVLSQHP